MTTNPSDEPQAPGTPPTPPPAYGAPAAGAPGAPGATPPPGYGTPPAGGYPPPPAGGYPPAGYGQPTQPPLTDAEQRQWAMFAHLGGILFSFIAPLVIWLVYKERGRFVEEQAKEALNFQITLVIAYFVGGILTVILIGTLVIAAAWIAAIVFGILAAVATNRGEAYRYPVNIRLIK